MTEKFEPRRKFYSEDLPKYFLVEHLKNSIVVPDLYPLLEDYDITQDPQFKDENVPRRIEIFGLFLDHGFIEDRRLYVSFISAEMGYGAYADVYIPAWTVVGEYVGLITNKNANTDYAWVYHSRPKDAQGNELKLRVNARTCGNLLRFINYSDYPNCSVVHVPYKNRWRTVYVTNTNIMPDQELSAFYGETYWKNRRKHEEKS